MVVCTARAVQCSEPGLCSSCCNELFLYVLCNTMIIISGSSVQAARQTTAGSIDFREVQIASNGSKVSKSRHNSRTKLRMELLNAQKRDNTEYYLPCKFQCSPFSVFCKTDITDGMTHTQTNE